MRFDDIIIGGGLSGLVSGISLAEGGRKCLIVSQGQSTLNFSSGALEFLACEEGVSYEEALKTLPESHPYSKMGAEHLSYLRGEAAGLFGRAGIAMRSDLRCNHWRITPLGVLKPVWMSLKEMTYFSRESLPKKVLVAGIKGFLDFNASFVASGLAEAGVDAKVCEVSIRELDELRDNASEFRSANLARILDGYAIDRLAEAVRKEAEDVDCILLPAVFGLENAKSAERMLAKLGKEAAFIPTMAPSVPGIRLQKQLKKRFVALGGTFISGDNVLGAELKDGRIESIRTERHDDTRFGAENFIFACGSFFSNGLKATPEEIFEPILHLDVDYSGSHGDWFNEDVYAAQPYLSFGVKTDRSLHVCLGGKSLPNAWAVGQLLSGALPLKCGCLGGVSVLSALYAAGQIKLASL